MKLSGEFIVFPLYSLRLPDQVLRIVFLHLHIIVSFVALVMVVRLSRACAFNRAADGRVQP